MFNICSVDGEIRPPPIIVDILYECTKIMYEHSNSMDVNLLKVKLFFVEVYSNLL